MALRGVIVAVVLLAVLAPSARAARPVPGWDEHGESAVAVDDQGRGVVAFERDGGVAVATVARDGTVGTPAQVPAPASRDFIDLGLKVAMGPNGTIAVAWSAFTGERPQTPDGYGFARRVLAATWRYGDPPPPARQLEARVVEADLAGLAVRPDGTAALAYTTASDLSTRETARLALLPPGGEPRITTLAANGEAAALAGDAAGRLAVAWTSPRRLRIAAVDAAGTLRAPASFTTRHPTLDTDTVVLDARGGAVAAWQERVSPPRTTGRIRYEVRVALRRAGSRRFAKPAVAIAARDWGADLDVARGPGGRAVIAWQRGESLYARLLEASGRLTRTRRLAAHLLQPLPSVSGVDARGRASVAFGALAGRNLAARVTRARPGASFGPGPATIAPHCYALDLAIAPGGPGLLSARCDAGGDAVRGVVAPL